MVYKAAAAILDLIYPRQCLLCHNKMPAAEGSRKDLICRSCLNNIKPNSPPFCQKCGRKIKGNCLSKGVCAECRRTHYHFDRAWASSAYDGAVKEMIHSFKYRNKPHLKGHLAKLMIDFINDYRLPIEHCDYITPIPLSAVKLREREFNQSELLAQTIAARYRLNILKGNLTRKRDTPAQAGLDKNSRWSNIRGAFSIKDPQAVDKKIILLIDDVFTTGATASEAARALKEAGASVVFVMSVAN